MSMASRLSRVGAGGAVGAVVVDILDVVVSETWDSEVSVGVSERCGSVEEGLGVPGEEPTVAIGAENGVPVNSVVKLDKASKRDGGGSTEGMGSSTERLASEAARLGTVTGSGVGAGSGSGTGSGLGMGIRTLLSGKVITRLIELAGVAWGQGF